MIGVHVNADQAQRNTKFSSIKWIPKINGVWYATQTFSDHSRSEGYQITINGNVLSLKHQDENQTGVVLIAIYELLSN